LPGDRQSADKDGIVFVVTFHGGSGSNYSVYSYNDDGSGGQPYLSSALQPGTNGFRGIQFQPRQSGGSYYLVNSYQEKSQILKISPNGSASVFVPGVGTEGSGLASLYHPYGIAFDATLAVLYISNQDSNVVVRVYGPNTTDSGCVPGQPMPVNPTLVGLTPGAFFLPGTFVGSQVPLAPAPTTVTDAHGGLGASKGSGMTLHKPSNSVRGLAVVGTTLYVADEVSNLIRQYDIASGSYAGAVKDHHGLVLSPIDLLGNGEMLYITVEAAGSSGALVLQYDTSSQKLEAIVTRSKDLDIKHPSGMTFDGNGNFYLADLDNKAVYQFDSSFKPTATKPFISSMPDYPEGILWVNDAWLTSS